MTQVTGGRLAGLHYGIMRTAGVLTAPMKNRGMRVLARTLAPLFDPSDAAVVDLPDGLGKLRYRLNDRYWGGLASPRFHYEPDVFRVLRSTLREPAYFLDCGANIGLWSVMGAALTGPQRTVAVEAAPATFEQLVGNAELNANSFTPVQAALWSSAGETLRLVVHARRHAGNSLVNRDDVVGHDGYEAVSVPTTTLDALADEYFPDATLPVLVKLDVEGAEAAALEGADRLLRDRDVLLVYEDHGHDDTCQATRAVLERGLQPFIIQDKGFRPVSSVEEVRELKVDAVRGYNFAACKPGSALLARLS